MSLKICFYVRRRFGESGSELLPNLHVSHRTFSPVLNNLLLVLKCSRKPSRMKVLRTRVATKDFFIVPFLRKNFVLNRGRIIHFSLKIWFQIWQISSLKTTQNHLGRILSPTEPLFIILVQAGELIQKT